jgi:ABC-type nitrate/sulfonate/bicarbonate transport system permease component
MSDAYSDQSMPSSARLIWHASPLIGFFLLLALWQMAATLLDNPGVLPGPAATASAAVQLIANGSLPRDILSSLSRVMQGWLLAIIVAIPLGGLMGRVPLVRRIVLPMIEVIRPIPPIAMIPIAILWFGIGLGSQLFIVFYGAFFPMVIGIFDAFRSVDKIYEQAAQSLGCHRVQLFRRVVVMAALPNVISSLRIGLGLAFVSLVASELIAASTGLGALIANSRVLFQTDYVLVGMITIGLVGFVLGWLMTLLERRLLRYRT